MTGIPKEIKVTYEEVAYCLDRSVAKIEEATLKALELAPRIISRHSHQRYSPDGWALLHGLAERLSTKTKLSVQVTEDTLRAVVKGIGEIVKDLARYESVLIR